VRTNIENKEPFLPLFATGEYWQVKLFARAWVNKERTVLLEVAWFVSDHEKPPAILKCTSSVREYVAAYSTDLAT
jgi:hypothetical protein